MKTDVMMKELIEITKGIFTEEECWELVCDLYLFSLHELVMLLVVSNPHKLSEAEAFEAIQQCEELKGVLHDTVLEVSKVCDYKKCLSMAFYELMEKGSKAIIFAHSNTKKTSLS